MNLLLAGLVLVIVALVVAMSRASHTHDATVTQLKAVTHQRDMMSIAVVEILGARRPMDLKVQLMAARVAAEIVQNHGHVPTWLSKRLAAALAIDKPLYESLPLSFPTSDRPPPDDEDGGDGGGSGGAGSANGCNGTGTVNGGSEVASA